MDTDRTSWFVLSFKKLEKTSLSFLKSYQKMGIEGLSVSGMSGTVTSDYSDRKNIIEPWAGAEKYRRIIKKFSENSSLMLDAPIMHNAVCADRIINLPENSGFDMLDYGVPFYQMVIAGIIPYSGEAANLSDDPSNAVLTALKTGANLHYSLCSNAGSDIVKDTLYDGWIGADAEKWLETVKEQYEELKLVYESLGSQTIVDFEQRESGITVSYFEGGGELWINETENAISDGSITVEPESYCIRKAGMTVE
jgi:hypothetical protein